MISEKLTIMNKKKNIGMAIMAAGLLVAASCSDFDDYNKGVADVTASANQTLWQNIQQNPQLSDFASLVKKSGFDQDLDATQYYTVWAPLNGTFNASSYQELDKDALLRQFVKNHIASYGHLAAGTTEERVMMLNEKSYDFSGTSSYVFNGVDLAQANLPSNNGILHTLNGVASFYPNLYEFVTDKDLSAGKNIDSLRNYFLHYENTYLDTERSVLGSIVNGMQTYVDSVMITENSLWNSLNVKMNNEDSTYTFLMPTNEAWVKVCERIRSNYNYIPTTNAQTFTASGGVATTPISVTVDATYWQDSLTNRYLTRNLAYSNNNGYNKWLIGNATYLGKDTLFSTTRNKLSNPQEILGHTVEELKMSNGVARIVDDLGMHPWETYALERIYMATSGNVQARILAGNALTVNVVDPKPEQVDLSKVGTNTFRYLWVESSGGYSKPELDIYLPDVLSTTYDFYCVFVPQGLWSEKADIETRPNRVIFTLNYCDEKGALKDYVFLDESEENINSFTERFASATFKDNAANRTTFRAFSNDTTKVDTVYLGEFTFPVCYYGLGDGYCPNIKITSPFSAVTGKVRDAYTRDLRIAAIILKPKELVEFEESNKK